MGRATGGNGGHRAGREDAVNGLLHAAHTPFVVLRTTHTGDPSKRECEFDLKSTLAPTGKNVVTTSAAVVTGPEHRLRSQGRSL
jgi:hypothetical protein